ncbi:BLUF domain-containing protein [Hymenobacter nivis]|uniref:BLUF domain-containing protein n=1 Tax=Hymenobacter nivis TaxID=1850093 RepID=A0A502GY74_9BACT|nr:BLUF domain-containing protein [Hymenobacter nivis]TPG66392.1 BLUF domain-containing protein [Hymenobacter nivis]
MPTRPSALHHLVYLSRATAPLGVEALQQLLQKARTFNHAHRVTGLLLYSDGPDNTPGVFFQILEGPEDVIRSLVSGIRLDERNTDLHVLVDGPAAQRMFPDWAMGFSALVPPDMEALTGYVDPTKPRFLLPRAHAMSPELRQLLDQVLAEYPVWPHALG